MASLFPWCVCSTKITQCHQLHISIEYTNQIVGWDEMYIVTMHKQTENGD